MLLMYAKGSRNCSGVGRNVGHSRNRRAAGAPLQLDARLDGALELRRAEVPGADVELRGRARSTLRTPLGGGVDDAMVRARAVGLTRTAVLFRPSRVAETTSDAFSRRPLLETPRGACARVIPAFPSSRARPVARGCGLLVASVALALVASASAQLVCARVEPSENANTSATTKCTPLVPALLPDDALTRRRRDALARCACAHARRACDLRDATCEIRVGARPHHRKPRVPRSAVRAVRRRSHVPEGAPRERLYACAAARWTEASSPRASTRFGAPGPTDGTPPGSSSSPSTPWWPPPSRGGSDPRVRIRPILPARIPTSPPNTRCGSEMRTPPRDPRSQSTLLAVRTTRYRLPDRPRRGVASPRPSSRPAPARTERHS